MKSETYSAENKQRTKSIVPDKRKQGFQYLKEAYNAFRRKNYSNAIIILEKAGSAGINEPYTFFLQAVSYLYLSNFSRADQIISRLEKADPYYTPLLHLKAFLGMKSSTKPEEAVAYYISALEIQPADRMLKKAVKSIEKADDFFKFQKAAKISDFVDIPGPKNVKAATGGRAQYLRDKDADSGEKVPRRKPLIYILMIFLILITAGIFFYWKDKHRSSVAENTAGPGNTEKIDMVNLSGAGYGLLNRINSRPTKEFYTTGDEIIRDFDESRKLIKKGEYNRAIIILNKISSSNSSYTVKEKTEFLIRFILESEDRVYEKADLKQIELKPYLYRGTALKLNGRAANVAATRKGTGFTLMVDYDGSNFKGIIDVFDKTGTAVKTGDHVEVDGVFFPGIGGSNKPYVSAETVIIR